MKKQNIATDGLQSVSQIAAQYVYLDFDGELTSYNGEILTIENVNVADSGISQERIREIITKLNDKYSSQNILFVSETPEAGEYSTVFVGKTTAFDKYGEFYGISETVSEGSLNKTDNAFVMLDFSASNEDIINIIAHETEHLQGRSHAETYGDLRDYAYTESEGSGNWNDTRSTADYLGQLTSSITVNGHLQSRYMAADQDWYYFYATTNYLKYSISTVGLVNTRSIVLFPTSGSGIVLANEDINSRTGVIKVTPGGKYYIHCTDSFSGMGPYNFTLSAVNSSNSSNKKYFADLAFYRVSRSKKMLFYPDEYQPNNNLYADINTYLKIAVTNNGKSDASASTISVYIDNYLHTEIPIGSIDYGYFRTIKDIDLGILSAGKHKITVKLDTYNSIEEKSEKNNILTKTITVKKTPLPDFKFYKPKGWKSSVKIYSVNSKTFYNDQNIFLDFAVLNKAIRDTGATTVGIYIDNIHYDDIKLESLSPNDYATSQYIVIGKLSSGKHKISLRIDNNNKVYESNEKNNFYSKTIKVKQGMSSSYIAYDSNNSSLILNDAQNNGILLQGSVSANKKSDEIFFDIQKNNSRFILDFDEKTDSAIAKNKLEISCRDKFDNVVSLKKDSDSRLYCEQELSDGTYTLYITSLKKNYNAEINAELTVFTTES